MLVRLDTAAVAVDADDLGSIATNVSTATTTLVSSLNACSGMAGIDPMAEEFAQGSAEEGGYDLSAGTMADTGVTLAQVVAGLEAQVLGLAAGYRAVELAGASTGDNAFASMSATSVAASCLAVSSALGDENRGTALGDIEQWIEDFLKDSAGIVIPTADTAKVGRAASAWDAFGTSLTQAQSQVSAALPVVLAADFPQRADVSASRDRIAQLLSDASADAGKLAQGCRDFVTNVDSIRDELRSMIAQLALEIAIDIGVGVALSFFTFGAGAVAGIAKAAETVVSWIVRFVEVVSRLKGLVQAAKVLMALARRGTMEVIKGTISGTVANAGSSLAFGNFSWSNLGGAAIASGIGGVFSAPFASVGSRIVSRTGRVAAISGVGAVTGGVGGFAGDFVASQVTGQQFNAVMSVLGGTVGGAAGGGLGNIRAAHAGDGISTSAGEIGASGTGGSGAADAGLASGGEAGTSGDAAGSSASGAGGAGSGGAAAGSGGAAAGSGAAGSTGSGGGVNTPDVPAVGGASSGGGGSSHGGGGAAAHTTVDAPSVGQGDVSGQGSGAGQGGAASGGAQSSGGAHAVTIGDGHVDVPAHLDTSAGTGAAASGGSTHVADGDTTTGTADAASGGAVHDTAAPASSDVDAPANSRDAEAAATGTGDEVEASTTVHDGSVTTTHDGSAAPTSHDDAATVMSDGGSHIAGDVSHPDVSATNAHVEMDGQSDYTSSIDGLDSDGSSPHVPEHTNLSAPLPHQGADAPQLPPRELAAINDEFRLANGEVDPSRIGDWAQKMSDAYPALTPEQVRGIYDYTTDPGYEAMNPYLRDLLSNPPADVAGLETRITNTTEGLANLPAAPSLGAPYTRGVGITPDFLDQFTVGERWSDPAFMSASNDASVADRFATNAVDRGETAGVITIDAQTPVEVSPFSRYQHESEFLFQRGTEFEVVSKVLDEDQIWRVHLREVVR